MNATEHAVNPQLNQYDFDGACAPHTGLTANWESFTLGIFQWVAKSGGKGLKRSKIIQKVKGQSKDPGPAYEKARKLVATLNQALEAKD
jgi:hypothetical protein